ncbi:hypothetical protein CERZMDRAFT_90255 [Cercospora zeae-maydis SCOH1-5]|uniref:Uncharacterized protein n=1 Tax=Cercospora zeae-maydis SCOH1-5 TaxID=717836 RepID=A0A6A6FNK7_9PEZI|nr:hypothetical protein CERZMDRAFT_90255 [Cercospora zeae-maydis SCOH1-5]
MRTPILEGKTPGRYGVGQHVACDFGPAPYNSGKQHTQTTATLTCHRPCPPEFSFLL